MITRAAKILKLTMTGLDRSPNIETPLKYNRLSNVGFSPVKIGAEADDVYKGSGSDVPHSLSIILSENLPQENLNDSCSPNNVCESFSSHNVRKSSSPEIFIESPPPDSIKGLEFLLEDSFYDSDKDPGYYPSDHSSDKHFDEDIDLTGTSKRNVKKSKPKMGKFKKNKIEGVSSRIELEKINQEKHELQNTEIYMETANNIKFANTNQETRVKAKQRSDPKQVEYSKNNMERKSEKQFAIVETGQINQDENVAWTSKQRRLQPNNIENPKRVRSKDFCYFCESLVLNFARHIVTSHSYEIEVQKILSKPVGSKERKLLLATLRKRGNYLNCKSQFKPMKKPNLPYSQDQYLPCEFCLGLYVNKQLWRHKKKCQLQVQESNVNTKSFLLNMSVDRELQEKVFPKMRKDHVSLVAQKDPLICAFGARYLKSHREIHFINVTSRKMRELSKVLMELKKIEPSINNLFQALNPKFYDHIVTATKIIARYDIEKQTFRAPTFAINISTSLKQCCDLAIVCALKKKYIYADIATAEAESDIKTMIQLLENHWRYDISTEACSNLNMQKWNKITIVPLANDLKLLKEYLCAEAETAANVLKSNLTDDKSYNKLLETIFCRVILLNRKRPGELQRLLLDTYQNSESQIHQNYEEFSSAILPAEKILMQKFKRIVIRGKRDRGVPVLFSPDVQEHIRVLLAVRDNYVPVTNRYFFATAKSRNQTLVGYKVLARYANSCNAKNPKALTSTRLRKHLATLSQVFNMTENDLEQLATFMGHTTGIHRKSYRLPDDVYQTAKISKILLLMENGLAADFRGKSLDEITVDMDENLMKGNENTEEETEEFIPTEEDIQETVCVTQECLDNNNQRKLKKHIKRVRWTDEQKNILKTYFKNHIMLKKTPTETECAEVKAQFPDILHNKDWKKMKVFIQNVYTQKQK